MESDSALGTDAEYETDELSANEKRWARALDQMLIVVPSVKDDGTATGVYKVLSENRSAYVVDPVRKACTCPDFAYNEPEDPGCKHIRRVLLLDEVDEDFPRRDEDAGAYADRLREVLDILELRRDVLAGDAFEDVDGAGEPDTDPEELQTVEWFVERLRNHETLEE